MSKKEKNEDAVTKHSKDYSRKKIRNQREAKKKKEEEKDEDIMNTQVKEMKAIQKQSINDSIHNFHVLRDEELIISFRDEFPQTRPIDRVLEKSTTLPVLRKSRNPVCPFVTDGADLIGTDVGTSKGRTMADVAEIWVPNENVVSDGVSGRTDEDFPAFFGAGKLMVRSTEAGDCFADVCKSFGELILVGDLVSGVCRSLVLVQKWEGNIFAVEKICGGYTCCMMGGRAINVEGGVNRRLPVDGSI